MNHIKKIAAQLVRDRLDAMLLTAEPGEFYGVGFRGEGTLLITASEAYYFTDSRYIEAAKKTVTGARITMTGMGRSALDLLEQTACACGIKRLGFEDGYTTVAQFNQLKARLKQCELVPAQGLMLTLRAAKDDEELAAMRKAQRITEDAFTQILAFLRPGMTEQEAAARLIYELYLHGAQRLAFDPIVVGGPNGSLPHGVPGLRKIQKGDFITMDFGAWVDGYCADMTRTVAMGSVTPEMDQVYNTVLNAQLEGIRTAKAGLPGKEIDAAARTVIEEAGYGAYFGHSFGHSLGIEIHEGPNFAPSEERIMPAGAVVSAEPGIYLPGKFGVRIEDVIVLREGGCEILTKAPKELITL